MDLWDLVFKFKHKFKSTFINSYHKCFEEEKKNNNCFKAEEIWVLTDSTQLPISVIFLIVLVDFLYSRKFEFNFQFFFRNAKIRIRTISFFKTPIRIFRNPDFGFGFSDFVFPFSDFVFPSQIQRKISAGFLGSKFFWSPKISTTPLELAGTARGFLPGA